MNAGLYDKTIGGHVAHHESVTVSVVQECAEELGFPVAVLSDDVFTAAARSTDLEAIGILRKVGEDQNFLSKRKSKTGDFIQPYISYFFIGYYDGSIQFKDGESSGLETFSLEELRTELSNNPQQFTDNLHAMVKQFAQYLLPNTQPIEVRPL